MRNTVLTLSKRLTKRKLHRRLSELITSFEHKQCKHRNSQPRLNDSVHKKLYVNLAQCMLQLFKFVQQGVDINDGTIEHKCTNFQTMEGVSQGLQHPRQQSALSPKQYMGQSGRDRIQLIGEHPH